MSRTRLALIGSIAAIAMFAAACSSDSSTTSAASAGTESMSSATPDTSSMTITDIAAANPDFSTLVAAIDAGGLTETLSGEGPYTVFAPTNAAFEALPAGTLDSLIKPANKDQLAEILTYHVVAGEVMAADVTPGNVTTVNGADLTVSEDMGTVSITDGQGNTAQVTATDIVASNGVIHVIDAVLLPPSN
jgi:uncharacterized surface protein with fasciclin (FAS1) repeats